MSRGYPEFAMLVIFTDLDGTLLDAETYRWDAATPALAAVRARGIPLVLVSSKTRAEMEPLRRELSNAHPFVVENGAATYIPPHYFQAPVEGAMQRAGYDVLECGRRYETIVAALRDLSVRAGCAVTGFADMSPEEVAAHTGMPVALAVRAKQREYGEPFLVQSKDQEKQLVRAIEAAGLQWTHGGRFHHIFASGCDKGQAVEHLTRLYRSERPDVTTVALGDSANDVPMLERADIPVLIRSRSAGSAEWNDAVLRLLDQYESST